ncbi:peptidoglycan DD-metalloendopeptidase family protein [Buchnera aphidicola]
MIFLKFSNAFIKKIKYLSIISIISVFLLNSSIVYSCSKIILIFDNNFKENNKNILNKLVLPIKNIILKGTSNLEFNDYLLKLSNFYGSPIHKCIYNFPYKKLQNNNLNNLKYIIFKSKIDNNFIKNMQYLNVSNDNIDNVVRCIKLELKIHQLKQDHKCNILIQNNSFLKHNIVQKNIILSFEIPYNTKNIYGFFTKKNKFFDVHGISSAPIFLKFPFLKKYRISSKFNPNRFNPITKKNSPHQGIDFAMPIGTPILSIGDGVILNAKFSIQAGNYITIQHNCSYITKYMHLKKILVKIGDKVKMRDKIGLSGNTGYSTGPHLHYEVWLHKKVINPKNLKTRECLIKKNLKEHINFSNIIITQFEIFK